MVAGVISIDDFRFLLKFDGFRDLRLPNYLREAETILEVSLYSVAKYHFIAPELTSG